MSERTKTDAGLAIPALMEATLFAAEKHRDQRRKDARQTPYVNHPITVVNLLAGVGGISDVDVLQAGMLHDTVEDTDTKPDEIEELFGYGVRSLVMEVTDDKCLPKDERKRLQIEHAPYLSPRAKTIKIADKVANLADLRTSPPADWSADRIKQYIEWSNAVVEGCKGQNTSLYAKYRSVASAL